MTEPLSHHYLAATVSLFRSQKSLAERAIEQLDDEQLHRAAGPESNSVAVIMKHMAGNMLSRWTDFLTTDGEKPGRDRDSEFVDTAPGREACVEQWERGWQCLFDALAGLEAVDLLDSVTIRGESHTIVEAIQRQVSHYGYHVGQIVSQARELAGSSWKTLSIPRGASEEFNRGMGHQKS